MDYQPQDPASGAPDPNQAPYQPPSGGYAPPTGDPQAPSGYQPSQQPAGGYAPPGSYPPPQGGPAPGQGYAPAGGGYGGGYQAPPKKGGFNWLACCGIGCAVVIVVGILVCALMWKVIAPIVGVGMDAAKVGELVQKTDLPTIKASATDVDDATLAASPDQYSNKWVKLTATLGDEHMASGSVNSSSSQGTTYITEHSIMITDTSNTSRVGLKGDSIVAYGQVMVMDLAKMMPYLKDEMEKEMAKNPGASGGIKDGKITMFMAKSVELAGGSGEDETAPPDAQKKAGAKTDDSAKDEETSKDDSSSKDETPPADDSKGG